MKRSNRRRWIASTLIGVLVAATLWLTLLGGRGVEAAWVWVEGERPFRSTMQRFPAWYDQVTRDKLSGGDFISHWSDTVAGEASYRVNAPTAGSYEFWVRANATDTRLLYTLNDAPWTEIDTKRNTRDVINIARDGKIDLRFLAWIRVGNVTLKQGANLVRFRMDSVNHHHGYLDCFVFTNERFNPSGAAQPNQLRAIASRVAAENQGWFAFDPPEDAFKVTSAIDLRGLNEKRAGDGGRIVVKDGRFVHEKTGQSVRFWAVNGPPGKDPETLRKEARTLAKRGVNLVRVHHGYYDTAGKLDPRIVAELGNVVAAMKHEGIYSHISIYFPLWLTPPSDTPWLQGYDGKKHPFASLMFNPAFQKVYQDWWRAVLLTPNPTTGAKLIDDPAVFGLEIQNEDSFFFWTFATQNLPDEQLRILETHFAHWLEKQCGSLDTALARWRGLRVERDAPSEGRIGFRPLYNIANEKTQRDQDTVRFLAEVQQAFYRDQVQFLRQLGYRGLITASNWTTASAEILGPIEKLTYTAGDFLDRHGYFAGKHDGDNASWSIQNGQVFADRSALRFDGDTPTKPKLFTHPAMDPKYDNLPSMISETTWNRPNRYRSEAPLYYGVYGALQGSDAIVHFACDTTNWSVKPNFFMQPWTIMAPSQAGQFPAAALIFRQGLVEEGDVLADIHLAPSKLLALEGTPLPQDAALDELRAKDLPLQGGKPLPGTRIDPLIHLAGRTAVHFQEKGKPSTVADLRPYIDRAKQTVVSTHRQVKLDYGKGVLTINAPAAQGASGNLAAAGTVTTNDLTISSPLDQLHVVAVSFDGQPLATSKRILLQVMSEEKTTGFKTEPAADSMHKILDIGRDPWLVRDIEGKVLFRRADASSLAVTPLDPNGDPIPDAPKGTANSITLSRDVVYYLISPSAN